MQALHTTAVNLGPSAEAAYKLQQEAQPQATGNGACTQYSNELIKNNNSTKKNKKRRKLT